MPRKKAGVNVFRRFALMRHWNRDCNIPIDQMINHGEHLHQSDWCTNCVAQALDAPFPMPYPNSLKFA